MEKDLYKLPRLHTDQNFNNEKIALCSAQVHYLKNVLRHEPGQNIRLFNGRQGEYTAKIAKLTRREGQAILTKKIREQISDTRIVHLLFSPIKKHRLDIMIEKAVELGATHFHPVITARTENRRVNIERISLQIREAAEQCERMTIPYLLPVQPLGQKITLWSGKDKIYWCRERYGGQKPIDKPVIGAESAFLIGPEGGFDEAECRELEKTAAIKEMSLGQSILRSETAALLCMAMVRLAEK